MRLAFKIAYFGLNFHGSQYQPDVRTIEGELFKAFKKLGVDPKKSRYRCASRTDTGVHAFSQVIALNSKEVIPPRMLNANLPEDITVWAWAKVKSTFDPRKAKSRRYMYVLPTKNYDISAMRKATKLLLGTHDFCNFTRGFGGEESCVRTIYNVELRIDRDFVIFEIEGNAFTWNMVRCIVTALEEVGSRHRDIEWFEKMLDPEKHRERIEPAPPHGLILKDIKYDDVEFETDEYAWKTLQNKFSKKASYYGTIYKLLSSFIE
ncbi:tRNA pseudouridine(38-40) synthase TruA [Archaeoglobales archaeon]|nr:MAG: tRNA pseudouridine(38-40) synthase TruA [Archaeoglobales archaeon]